jgi:hypothetical protein
LDLLWPRPGALNMVTMQEDRGDSCVYLPVCDSRGSGTSDGALLRDSKKILCV